MKMLVHGLCMLLFTAGAWAAPDLTIDVDAREIARSLLHARVEIPVAKPGELIVWYPKWIPGIHAPGGPVQNLAGLTFETAAGVPITWRRDEEEPARFHVEVPAGTDRVVAKLEYICNQPSVNSSGIDSFGNAKVGVINWNTVLLYPESASIDAATAAVRVTLPAGWRFGTSLKPASIDGGKVDWKPETPIPGAQPYTVGFTADTLRRVVDSPLICGENFRTIELTGKATPPAFLHLTSEAASAIAIDDQLIARYRALVAEAVALFGGAPFAEYHFLVVCSDQIPYNGLEHLSSSFNVVGERGLIDAKERKSWPAYLLPHEFVHAWCGKFRRPGTMVTTNFHTPERTRLLWVYEGLTQYLGEVLTIRSGILTFEEYLPSLAGKIDYLKAQAGRKWRSVEDTAISSWQLRGKSDAWAGLRRSQDYYDEGLITWLEADALIREKSGGALSLDHFCKKFFAGKATPQAALLPYELPDVIGLLKSLVDLDWEKFFRERIQQPKPNLELAFVDRLGYRLQFSPKPSEELLAREKDRKYVSATASLGVSVNEDGKIGTIVPDLPADKAGLASGQILTGVNERKFTAQRLKDALAESPTRGKIDLLLLAGDVFKTVSIPYNEGPKYLELTRIPDRTDILAALLKPTLAGEQKKEDGK